MVENFLRPTILVDGETQVLIQDGSINLDPKLNPVELMSGLGGFTPGPKSVTISVTSAIRTSGPEFDPAQAMTDGTTHEIQFVYGAKTIVSEGQITSGSMAFGVAESAKLTFEFMGTFNPPK